MTQAKAQTVASALIGAGHAVQVSSKDGDWAVRVVEGTGTLALTVSDFATAQNVTATVKDVEFK